MKLSLAIDRLKDVQAETFISQLHQDCDIVEIGTSFTKEYGVEFVRRIKKRYPQTTLFADIKTVDEATYEFQLYYDAGADVVSVLGSADIQTLLLAQTCAKQNNKEYVIDLLGINADMIEKVQKFGDAIFCIHVPSDLQGDVTSLVKQTIDKLPGCSKKAAAGGICLEQIKELHQAGIHIAMIGGSILKTTDPKQSLLKFKKGMYDCDRTD